tara:strand:+ start:493 stop:1191 length:699 start_codon:yes stop_codon:yes gene_type:complete
MNEQIVYYGYSNDIDRPHGMFNGKEPTLALKEFLDDASEVGFLKCPAYKDFMANVFAVGSWFNLELVVEHNGLRSEVPQKFIDSYIKTHSDKRKVYQILQEAMFIAKGDSLEMTQEQASMSDNGFTKGCSVISGTFDIGRHFRLVSPAFFIRQGVNNINIKEDDSLYYIRFHTKKRIKLVPFFMSPKFEALTRNLSFKKDGNSYKPLDYYYKLFKKKNLKRLLIEEIEKNLL